MCQAMLSVPKLREDKLWSVVDIGTQATTSKRTVPVYKAGLGHTVACVGKCGQFKPWQDTTAGCVLHIVSIMPPKTWIKQIFPFSS